MTVDAAVIRAEPHEEFGALIQQDATLIVEAWARRAAHEQPQAKRIHHAALLDHLPGLLWELGASLAIADENGDCNHCPPARLHGQTRWQTGWSLVEVVRDYQILRLVLVEHAEQNLRRPLRSREFMAVGLALDEAISASVDAFVREQDLRGQQMRQGLEEANRRKDAFLALLGHELRNPLSAMVGGLELLKLIGAQSGEAAEARELVERQARLMNRLVDDLLDVARIARGKISLDRVPVDLAALVRIAAEDSRRALEERQLSLSVEVSDSPLYCLGDAERLTQVVANLLNNAGKFTRPGGVVTIRLAADSASNFAVLTVTDTGIGIAADLLPHVFELFTQAEAAANRTHGGLGLGLALVKGLAELHGGFVAATSGPGQGCTFEVRLPAIVAPVVPSAPLPSANIAPLRCRVLVIDDNRDTSYTVTRLLERDGHQVEVAANGPDGLAVAARCKPQLVICDIGLPEMDGYEVARALRQDPMLTAAYLAAVTGYGREEDRQRALSAGFDTHVTKPIGLVDLRRVIRAVGERSGDAS